MSSKRLPVLTISMIAGLYSQQTRAQSYTFKPLDLSKSYSTYLESINQSGQILGVTLSQCFLVTGNQRVHISNGYAEFCSGLNTSDTIVGTHYPRPHSGGTGFIYRSGMSQDVNPSGNNGITDAFGVSDTGLVTGSYYDNSGVRHGYVLNGSKYQTIDVAGAASTIGIGINNSGQVTLFTADGNGNVRSFLKSGSHISEIAFPGAATTFANGINNSGQVALCWTAVNGPSHGGVYDSKTNAYYQIDYPGKAATCVYGINDKQSLVGTYQVTRDLSRYHGFVASGHLP